jgi:hypothetical protein
LRRNVRQSEQKYLEPEQLPRRAPALDNSKTILTEKSAKVQ